MTLRIECVRNGIDLEDLRAQLQGALEAEGRESGVDITLSVEERDDGLDGVTTFVLLWLVKHAVGKAADAVLAAVWRRVLDRVHAARGHHVVQPRNDNADPAVQG